MIGQFPHRPKGVEHQALKAAYAVPVPTSTTLSRRELYDWVWSEPMTKVSAALGISSRGLAKICVRHQIPTPPRGYWAQVAAGRNRPGPAFVDLGDQDTKPLTIFDTLSALPHGVGDVVREARKKQKELRGGPLGVVKFDPDHVEIPPIIASIAKVLRTSEPGVAGEVQTSEIGRSAVKVHYLQIERAVSFLSRLSSNLLEAGLDVLPTSNAIGIANGPDKLEFTLTERTRHRILEPISGGLHIQQNRADQRTHPESVYTGEFVVAVVSWGGTGLRKKWADGKARTVETLLPDIVGGLLAFIEAEKAKREDREQRRRQRQHIEHRKLLAQQRRDREEKRIVHLNRIVDMRREANNIRNWLTTLPIDQVVTDCTEIGRMVRWATSRQSLLDRLTTLEAVSALVVGRNLFPEIDDLQDPEGDFLS